jgi:DNA repair protein RecO (recombination protein O)
MPEPRNYQTEAVVIKKTKLGEADTILTFMTPDLGKTQGFGKSLRKTTSKMAGHLELLTHSTVSFARGRSIATITGAQTIHAFLPLKEDLWLTACGVYVAELVNHFASEHQENAPLFDLLVATLSRLNDGDDPDFVLRYFEVHLLDTAGYRPQLRECVVCHRPLEPQINFFSPPAGGLFCPACRDAQGFGQEVSLNAQKVLRYLQGNDYAAASRVRLESVLLREIEGLMTQLLRYHLEREVKSAAWLDTLRDQMAQLSPGPATTETPES